jgi:hypothetical protein
MRKLAARYLQALSLILIMNAKVYDLLKSLAGNGPLQPFIRTYERTRNGRAAWKNLVQYYEGDSMKNRLKSSAYKMIQKASYQGPRRNFEFSNYVTIHQKAHEHLARFGEPVAELKKVRDFLDGITDPRCQAVKLAVQANMLYMNNFNEMVNYVTGALDLLNNQGAPPSTHRIGDLSSHERSQGRGRGRGRNANLARSHSPEEWQALSADERARVFQARERNNSNRSGGYNRGGSRQGNYRGGRGRGRYHGGGGGGHSTEGGGPRSNASLNTVSEVDDGIILDDNISAVTGPTAATGNPTNTSTNNIGERMTRRQRLNAVLSSVRRIKTSGNRLISSIEALSSCRAELDSHADTCAVGSTAYILEYTDRVVDVAPFSDDYQQMEEIPIVKAAFAYDDPATGETFILTFGQALYFGSKIKNALLKLMTFQGIYPQDTKNPRILFTSQKRKYASL